MSLVGDPEDAHRIGAYRPWYLPLRSKTCNADPYRRGSAFAHAPWWTPLIFENDSSDARDHCANERTFLSYLRLSVYMSVVSIAIILSFHLKDEPSDFELRMALPLGIVFWCLGLLCLVLGFGNYVKTMTLYSKRVALVQSGWKTQTTFGLVAASIVAVCILFLATNSTKDS
ncbi:hypothetical protein V500_05172 [Pseudogymnoascus sp. VKM F-4518 (FW-2643)]|nr:hypothetical protein V500_05172 [Pseudogymnoascus sp. VKM F-4518 (FW-2643)]KFZ15352.1 hypothetical protein V502_05658 [Pseudogymnoascus sp. VKM F-4520 (FW-2644)]